MILTFEPDSDKPLYGQIADGIRSAISRGELEPGSRLPPGRELALSIDVNLETVQRAYRLLAEEGIVESRVGRGTRVAEGVDTGIGVQPEIDRLIAAARRAGMSLEEVKAQLASRFGR